MATCRSCEQTVLWAKFAETGRAVPLDPEPDPTGGVVMLASTHADGSPLVRALKGNDIVDNSRRYRTHFQTCPKAQDHRRR